MKSKSSILQLGLYCHHQIPLTVTAPSSALSPVFSSLALEYVPLRTSGHSPSATCCGTYANANETSAACHRSTGLAAKLPCRRLQDRDLRNRASLPELHPGAQGHRRPPDQSTCWCPLHECVRTMVSYSANADCCRSQSASATA